MRKLITVWNILIISEIRRLWYVYIKYGVSESKTHTHKKKEVKQKYSDGV